MKKTAIALLLTLSIVLTLSGCGESTSDKNEESGFVSENKPPLENVTDYSLFNDPYNTILQFMVNPQDYQGQNIKIDAISSVVYNFDQNKIMSHIMLGLDPTGCCNASYEIREESGKYPENGTTATFAGTFTPDGYIDIYSWEGTPSAYQAYDIDALDLTSEQMNIMITDYLSNYSTSDQANKTVRIFGHHLIWSGYKYLAGLTADGVMTWNIELYDPTGSLSFPVVSGNLVNPVEIIGVFSVYEENGIIYPCITVTKVNKVECVFS